MVSPAVPQPPESWLRDLQTGVGVSSFRYRRIAGVAVLVPMRRIIFAQRMPFPIERHKNTDQVGMITESDAEHVEHFALIPVGRSPYACYRVDLRIVSAQAALHP